MAADSCAVDSVLITQSLYVTVRVMCSVIISLRGMLDNFCFVAMKAGISVLSFMTILYECWCSKSSGNFFTGVCHHDKDGCDSSQQNAKLLAEASSCLYTCFFYVYNILMYGILK